STSYQIGSAVSDETTVEGYRNNINGDSSSYAIDLFKTATAQPMHFRSTSSRTRNLCFFIEFYYKVLDFV
ncbi:unnamed protein product, partial [Brassica rapa subsp. trilocularis]